MNKKGLRWGLGILGVFLASVLFWLNGCQGSMKIEPLRPNAGTLVVDEKLEIVRRYAPFIYKEFHPEKGRQDIPSPVDFDGDLRGDNNWNAFPYYELIPTVYYAVLETQTHYFLSYHLFHPRDWSTFDLGLHMSHENDGENFQVVVDKRSGLPILLFTQAHYGGRAYINVDSGFADGEERLRGPYVVVDDEGVPSAEGRHACVFVESGGHGIYGTLDRKSRVSIDSNGTARFRKNGWVLRPRKEGEALREPELVSGAVVPYQLESTTAKLWPLLARGELTGSGRLLDRSLRYTGAQIEIDVPRYYEADRYSGPFGADRGIAPFAVDFRFGAGEVGALFFSPAERYIESLSVPGAWSVEYIDYPFKLD